MKTKLSALFFVLALMVSLVCPAFAQEYDAFVDESDWIASSYAEEWGYATLPGISNLHDFDLRVCIADRMDGVDLDSYASELYSSWGCGMGVNGEEGALLLIGIDGFWDNGAPYFIDYAISIHGQRSSLFAGDGISQLEDGLDTYLNADFLSNADPETSHEQYVQAIEFFAQTIEQLLTEGSDTPVPMPSYAMPDTFVLDNSDLLTADETAELNDRAELITAQYGCATTIVTVPDTMDMEPWEFSEQLHQEYSLGYGDEQSAVMLLLSTDNRDYNLMAYGYGNTAFTDWGKSVMEERFVPYLSDDDYYSAFSVYLDCCEEYLNMARAGTPFDIDTDPAANEADPVMVLIGLGIGILLPLLIALVVCQIFKAQMKTAKKQEMAHNYITSDGLTLSAQSDTFLHTTRVVRKIEKDDNDCGGTSINSGGYSHSSGKY